MINRTFRYQESASWFKGNTHLHTTASDGGNTIVEIAELYAEAGYDFIFITDHGVCSNVEQSSPVAPPLLLLNGIELDGQDSKGSYYHVVCLGSVNVIIRNYNLEEAMILAKEQGALRILAHPRWCGNTMEEANRHDFDGVEIYNHVCHWLNGKSDGLTYWDNMLAKNPATLSFAADDAHLLSEHPGFNGGWIVINASELNEESVLKAIKMGQYYSSCGPDFKSIRLQGSILEIETSPVQFIRLAGPGNKGWRTGSFTGNLLTRTSIELPENWDYMYLEIEDGKGKRAWSNTLFV